VPVLAGPFPEPARSLRTPAGWVVVLVTAGLFGGVAARFGAAWELPAYLVFTAGLVALSVIDLRLFLLPNRLVYPTGFVAGGLLALAAVIDGELGDFGRALLAGAAAFCFFAVFHIISPRAMGFGDVRLSFVLGLFLGYLGWGELVLGLFLGFLYGAVIGIVLIVTRLKTRKDHVPFGPFLAAGTMTAVLVGSAILDWYSG
jgi:leader peptidase (prepilin peptidase)/N-methyltransferase